MIGNGVSKIIDFGLKKGKDFKAPATHPDQKL